MSANDRIKKVALVGVAGHSGSHIAEALLKTGKHQVTAITRLGSTSKIPEGIEAKRVDYDDHVSLVEGLRGHDALVITMGTMAPPDQEEKLVRAASDAGVPWVLPNEWSPDTSDIQLSREMLFGEGKYQLRETIKGLGNISYIAVSTGFWYEWSLAIGEAYGINIEKRTATFFDDGETSINTSTWPQVGRAVAGLFSLPVKSEGNKPCLEDFKNKHVYTSSFLINQKEMLESVLRVTKTKHDDWTVTYVPSKERWGASMEKMKSGFDRKAFVNAMYTRLFFPDGSGNVEAKYGLQNDVLGLPKEDLDQATADAVKYAGEGSFGFGG